MLEDVAVEHVWGLRVCVVEKTLDDAHYNAELRQVTHYRPNVVGNGDDSNDTYACAGKFMRRLRMSSLRNQILNER